MTSSVGSGKARRAPSFPRAPRLGHRHHHLTSGQPQAAIAQAGYPTPTAEPVPPGQPRATNDISTPRRPNPNPNPAAVSRSALGAVLAVDLGSVRPVVVALPVRFGVTLVVGATAPRMTSSGVLHPPDQGNRPGAPPGRHRGPEPEGPRGPGFLRRDGKLLQTARPLSQGRRTTRSSMFDGRWRAAVDRSTGPVGTALHRRGVTADVLTATGLLSATRHRRPHRDGPSALGHRDADRDRAARSARRPGGQGGRHGLGARGLLRFGDRPGGRRRPHVRLCLVPGRPGRGSPGPAAHGHPGRDRPHLLRAGQGGVARASRPGAGSWNGPSA